MTASLLPTYPGGTHFAGRGQSKTLLYLAAITFAGFLLRAYALNRYGLWLDECVQYHYALTNFDRILFDSPPEWMFLPMFITRAQILLGLDSDAWLLRLPSFLAGIASVPLLFLLAREMFGETAGFVASVLAAIWPRLVEYSQEARPYALLTFLIVTAAFVLLRLLRTQRPVYAFIFVAASLLALYDHFLALFPFASLSLFALIGIIASLFRSKTQDDETRYKRFLRTLSVTCAAFIVIAIGLLPVAGLYLGLFPHEQGATAITAAPLAFSRATLLSVFGEYLGLGAHWQSVLVWLFVLLGLASGVIRYRRGALLAVLCLALPLGLGVTSPIGGKLFTYSPRYVLFLLPFVIVLTAAGISFGAHLLASAAANGSVQRYLKTRGIAAIASASMVLITGPTLHALYASNPKQVPVDLRSVYSYLERTARPGDIILGASDVTLWKSGWFHYTDRYYFRPKAGTPSLKIIAIGSDPDRGPIPFREIDAANGRLLAAVVVRAPQLAELKAAAGADWKLACWGNTCILESRAEKPMSDRVDDFFSRFALVDPTSLQTLTKLHHQVEPQAR